MSGEQIAREVADALREVAQEVGSGEFVVTLSVVSGEPETPWDTDNSTTDTIDVPALIQEYPLKMVDGTLIRMSDKRVMIAAENGTVPTTNMTATILGQVHQIISVKTLAPSGVDIFYECQCRA